MALMNRLGVAANPYQGKTKKVLCVCSAGVLRSPTAAVVLSQEPYNYNTRAAGIDEEFALVPVDEVLLEWADQIVCMDAFQKSVLEQKLLLAGDTEAKCKILNLDIGDSYPYRDPELIQLIKEKYDAYLAT